MGLDQRGPGHGGWLPAGRVVVQQFRQGDGLLPQLAHVLAVGEQLDGVRAEDRRATRLQRDDAGAGAQVQSEHVDGAAQDAFGRVELAGGDPGQTTAHLLVGHPYPPSGGFEHLHRSLGDGGVEPVGKGVRPQQYLAAGPVAP